MRDFRKLEIWSEGISLAKKVILLSETLPDREKFGLAKQISRAAVSIPSNIAEGSSRTSDKENIHFLDISLGSSFELETQLMIIKGMSMASDNEIEQIIQELQVLQRRINAYRNSIKGGK